MIGNAGRVQENRDSLAHLLFIVDTSVGIIYCGIHVGRTQARVGAGGAREDFLRGAFALFDGRPLLTVPTPRDDERPISERWFD
jgi:hypothetical protein